MKTEQSDKSAVIEFLREKINDAHNSVRAREQSERVLLSGTDASWALAAKLHPSTANAPSFKKADRLKAAQGQGRIAAKCRHELEMLKQILAMIEQLELQPTP